MENGILDNTWFLSGADVYSKKSHCILTLTCYTTFYLHLPIVLQIACSNGQLGYGRRRRGVDSQPADPNKIFEVKMMTFLKVDEKLNVTDEAGIESLTEDMVDRMAEDVGAVERALADAEATLPWSRSAAGPGAPFQSSEGNEPVFIYYNTGYSHSQSFTVLAAGLLVFFYHWWTSWVVIRDKPTCSKFFT